MKKFKEVPHVKGAITPKIEGVFPELEYKSILEMIESIVDDVNNKQFAIEVRKLSLHIERGAAKDPDEIQTFDAVIQTTSIPTKVVESLEENLNRPLQESEILDIGMQIAFAITRTRQNMQADLEAATKMLLRSIIKNKESSASAAESLITTRIEAINLVKRSKGDPIKALLSLLSGHIS